jgi:hypothetical protein
MDRLRGPAKPKTCSIPITGLSLFFAERRPPLEAQHPELAKLEVFRVLNHQWGQLDDATRANYERKADYSRRSRSRQASAEKKKTGPDRSALKVSPYSMFLRSQHDILKRTSPDLSVTERSRESAARWAMMSEQQKMPYVNEAKRETRKLRKMPDGDDESDDSSCGVWTD